jgi:hypothetical protein
MIEILRLHSYYIFKLLIVFKLRFEKINPKV